MSDMKSRTASSNTDHSAKSNSKVLSSYYNSLLTLKEDLHLAQSMRSRSMVFMAGGISAGLIITLIALLHPAVALFWAVMPFVLASFAAKRYIRAGKVWRNIERRTEYYKRGIDRLTGVWQGRGRTGEEFARENHLYQSDLNVIGVWQRFGTKWAIWFMTRSQSQQNQRYATSAYGSISPAGIEQMKGPGQNPAQISLRHC